MGDKTAKRRLPRGGQRKQHGKLEPAAMLITAFQIQLGWKSLTALLHDRVPTGTGFKPHIENVKQLFNGRAVEIFGRVDICRAVVVRQQFLRSMGEPRVGTMLTHHFGHGANAGRRHERGTIGQLEGRNWQAPRALTTQAPIWP